MSGSFINGTWVHIATGALLGYQKWTPLNPDGFGYLLHIWFGDMDDTNAGSNDAAICICYPSK